MNNSTQKYVQLSVGDVLTFKHDIISSSGRILHKKGKKDKIRELVKSGGYWGKVSGYWIDEKITGVKLENEYGIWSLEAFEETCTKP